MGEDHDALSGTTGLGGRDPRSEIGHLDETNRAGHHVRQLAFPQVRDPRMDIERESLQLKMLPPPLTIMDNDE
jgi:hypothetical protein